ncbi:MAG TPA: hypothetical protein VGI16_12190 [Candidatus Acidoferrum sp.]
MRNRSKSRHTGSGRQEGYALLLAIFLLTILLIGLAAAAPGARTERQREKEEEMIWRGKQYVSAVKHYYRKNGRFPTSIEDLTKPKAGSLRYLRQEYKDPMNKTDGTWRLIYVGPSGQLIGSLKPPQNLQMPGTNGQLGTPAGSIGNAGSTIGAGQNGAQPGAAQAGTSSGFSSGFSSGSPTSQPAGAGQNGSGQSGTAPSDDNGNLSPSALDDTPTVIGGNIIGVGSKVNKKSVIVYDKAKNYRLFEFVWDPSKDLQAGGNPGGIQQIGTPGAPGQPGIGQAPGGTAPQPNPQQPMPAPAPSPPPQ